MIGGLDGIRAKSESVLPRKTILTRTPIANPDHLFPAVVVALTTAKNRPPPSYSPQRTSSLALRVGIRQISFTTSTASANSFELMKIKRFHAITYVARCHAPVSHRHAPVSHREATRKYEPEAPARHSTQRGTRANALPCWRFMWVSAGSISRRQRLPPMVTGLQTPLRKML